MIVKVIQRSVYHKIAEIELEIPKEVLKQKVWFKYGEFNVRDWLLDNEDEWVDKIDHKINETEFVFGNGLDNRYEGAFTNKDEDSEWLYEVKDKISGNL